MMFFGNNKDPKTKQPKGHSTLGFLFNPELGASISPLGDAASMFVNLIAMVFAMNGLFPKDHLSLVGAKNTKSLSLSSIFSTAWNGLSFNKEGLPKVILFFAVTGAMIFSTLALITVFLMMFVGKAHADNSSFFTSPNPSTDLAQTWLDFLFKNKPLSGYVDQDNHLISQYTGIQQALVTALSFYSNAILIFAAVILFYHLVTMVVHTAHQGVPMGKNASQIWAPIRLVVAIGLLVPVGVGGLNSGQYIAIQMASWGSGLASQVWDKFTAAFAQDSYVAPPAPDVEKLAYNIVAIKACQNIFNQSVADASANFVPMPDDAIIGVAEDAKNIPINVKTIMYFAPNSSRTNVCGEYTIPNPVKMTSGSLGATVSTAVATAQEAALLQALNTADTEVKSALAACGTTPCFMGGNQQPAYKDIIGLVAGSQQASVSQGVGNAVASVLKAGNLSALPNGFSWSSLGWISAGAYFNNIAHAQSEIEAAVKDSSPAVISPELDPTNNSRDAARRTYTEFMQWAVTARTRSPSLLDTGSVAGNITQKKCADPSLIADYNKFLEGATDEIESGSNISLIDIIFRIADYSATLNCAWNPDPKTEDFTLGIQLNEGDPFAELVRLGHANLNTAYNLLSGILALEVGGQTAVALSGAGAARFSNYASSSNVALKTLGFALSAGQGLASGAVQLIASLFSLLGLIFFAAGFSLAFLVPLIPFIRFFFNALTWVAMVLESVIMMPLVALAHLNPEGDGLPGGNAKAAYFFLFNIFLRPVLMIFGLMCGYLIFLTAIALLNKLYGLAVTGALGVGEHSSVFVSRMVFSVFYVILVYIAANNCFKLIISFPNHALAWLGAQSAPQESMGDSEHLTSLVPGVSGYAGQQLFSAVKSGGQAIGQGMTKAVDGAEGRRNQQQQAAEGVRQQQGRTSLDDKGRPLGGGKTRAINPPPPRVP